MQNFNYTHIVKCVPTLFKSIGKLVLATFVIGSFVGCDHNKSGHDCKVADLVGEKDKIEIVKLSEVAESIDYVPLETNLNSLVSRFFCVYMENERIYLSSIREVMIFDTQGKFIQNFNRSGNGPQEYSRLSNFCVEPSTGNIIVNFSKKMLEYDKDGKYLRTIQEPADPSYGGNHTSMFYKLAENRYLMIPSRSRNIVPFLGVLLDSTSTVIKEYPNHDLNSIPEFANGNTQFPDNKLSPFFAAEVYRTGDSSRIYFLNSDTVRVIDKDFNLKVLYAFNYGDYKMPYFVTLDDMQDQSRINVRKKAKESSRYSFLTVNLNRHAKETYNDVFWDGRTSPKESTDTYALYDKREGRLRYLKQPQKGIPGFENDLDGGFIFWPDYVSSNKKMIKIVSASRFKELAEMDFMNSDNFRELAAKLKDDDNPVAIIVKLKE